MDSLLADRPEGGTVTGAGGSVTTRRQALARAIHATDDRARTGCGISMQRTAPRSPGKAITRGFSDGHAQAREDSPFRAVMKSGRCAVTVARSAHSVPLYAAVRSCWWTVSMIWVACRAWGR